VRGLHAAASIGAARKRLERLSVSDLSAQSVDARSAFNHGLAAFRPWNQPFAFATFASLEG
jgi:hypothetical protein